MQMSPSGKRETVKKVALLTNELPPYRRPIFELLGRHPRLAVAAYLSTRKEPHRLWDGLHDLPNVKVQVMRSFAFYLRSRERERLVHLPAAVLPALLRNRPDAVISGEFGFRTLLAWVYCALFRKPLIVWSGEITYGAQFANRPQRFLRRFLSRRAAGFLAYGQAARWYLQSLGVDNRKISILKQAVDNEYWRNARQAADLHAVRAKHSITGKAALCVANLLYPKGIHHLIEAWAALPRTLQQANTLMLVGGGNQRAELEALAVSLDAQNLVFVGPVPPDALPAYYAAANFLVLPTLLDVWGLVVNEAMASGLPVLCSKYAGCAEELIIPGKTGDIFDPTDVAAFSALLARWLQTPHTTPDPAIQEHIQRWNFDSSMRGILEQLVSVGILSPDEAAFAPQPTKPSASS